MEITLKLTPEQVQIIQEGLDKLWFIYDNDKDGHKLHIVNSAETAIYLGLKQNGIENEAHLKQILGG